MAENEWVRFKFEVYGKVQGVFFRKVVFDGIIFD